MPCRERQPLSRLVTIPAAVPGAGGAAADYNRMFHDTAMATPTASAPAPAPASYEAALGELEQLVAALEAGQLPLDRLLENYKRGADLLGFCRARLEAVEQQVKVLEDGQLKPSNLAP